MTVTAQTAATETPDLKAVKQRQQATWAAGDYAAVGTTIQIVGERICEAVDVHAGESVLDVAAGNGNASLAAARRFCDVTSTDYVESLLERGRARAEAEGLPIRFEVADAEDLQFETDSFDVVTSTFGVMFTADQDAAASELSRVCKPGGRIGLANWTPTGLVGQLFKTIGSFVPPPPGVRSPALWGTHERLGELFARDVKTIEIESRTFNFRFRSPEHWIGLWREVYGPLHKAFDALDESGQAALTAAVTDVIGQHNVATDGTVVAPAEYLEVVVTRR
jgi:2-polyprenyl-3-methyl-5-hydroxy-6-metoxy-1,4-benzoquinol methylase